MQSRDAHKVETRPFDVTVVLLGSPNSGGAARAAVGLLSLWSAEGARVALIADQDRIREPDEPFEFIPIRGRPSSSASESRISNAVSGLTAALASMIQIRRAIRAQRHCFLLAFMDVSAIVTLAAAVGTPARVVVCERIDSSRHRISWQIRVLRSALYPRAWSITVNSAEPAAREVLRRVSRGRPVYIVPNPRPVNIPRADPATSRTILAVGRLVPQKRHDVLIDAFAQLHDELPDWKLLIVGEGPLRAELERQIERLGLSHKVELVGHVDDPRPFYAAAGVFALPSEYEGTSNALLEAAAAGLPCIVSDTAIPLNLGDVIISVSSDDVNSLAQALHRLCSDTKARTHLGDALHNRSKLPSDRDILDSWGEAMTGTVPS